MAPPNRQIDLTDPLQVAVKVTSLEGTLAMLQQQVSSGLNNVSSRLDAMGAEQRETTKVVSEVARQQHDLQSHSEGLNRLGKAIEAIAHEFGDWRKTHEAENKTVADKVTSFKGALFGFGALAGTVIAVALLWINAEFANVRRERDSMVQFQASERARIESKHDQDTAALRADLRDLKQTKELK